MVRVAGREFSWREGMTVDDLLKELADPYPYSVVRIGERLVSRPNFATATVPNESEVVLIPLVSGG
jgi:sulfur carrier protein ThiS